MNKACIHLEENYTIPVCDIVNQIWIDDHENSGNDLIPSWRDALDTIDERITYAGPVIFGTGWDCYGDTSDRLALEKHILNDYYTRQINCDSVLRWVMFLRNRMHDIMPKYVALYNAQVRLLAEDPLSPYHIEEEKHLQSNKLHDVNNHSSNVSENEISNESNSSSVTHNVGEDNTVSKDKVKFSNTPQALVSSEEAGDDIPLNYLSTFQVSDRDEDNTYNSNNNSSDTSASKSTSNDSNDFNSLESGSENKLEEYVKTIRGNILKFNNGQLIKDYQDVILNIEKMISDELKDLFFLIY